jgi:hypothetical protein
LTSAVTSIIATPARQRGVLAERLVDQRLQLGVREAEQARLRDQALDEGQQAAPALLGQEGRRRRLDEGAASGARLQQPLALELPIGARDRTASSSASARTVGIWSPAASAPVVTACLTCRTSWRYTGSPEPARTWNSGRASTNVLVH